MIYILFMLYIAGGLVANELLNCGDAERRAPANSLGRALVITIWPLFVLYGILKGICYVILLGLSDKKPKI